MALQTSADSPAPLRQVSQLIEGWVDRMGTIWIEGQVTEVNRRPGVCFLTVRDLLATVSISVTCSSGVLDASPAPVAEGSRVVLHAKPSFYLPTGRLSLQAREIRPVGEGELLARLERRKQLLAAEGLFDPRVKKRLPFLPRSVGLVTARGSAAERDVRQNARARWPAVQLVVRYAAMQGAGSASQVINAVRALEVGGEVDVIVIARGGGSVEDLLPFSDEALVRALSRSHTPVVSAIGHEPDSPLSDLVADLRAATPTDAAKRVVPDVAEERRRIAEARTRTARALRGWVDRELHQLSAVRSRPVMADPHVIVDSRAETVAQTLRAARRQIDLVVVTETTSLGHLSARLTTLGPAATLARGYAVVQSVAGDHDGRVVSSIDHAPPGSQLRIRVADGALSAAVLGAAPAAGTTRPDEPDTPDATDTEQSDPEEQT